MCILLATDAATLTSATRAKAATVSANAHFLPGPAHPIISKPSFCIGYTVPPPTDPTITEGRSNEKVRCLVFASSYSMIKCAQQLSTTLATSWPVDCQPFPEAESMDGSVTKPVAINIAAIAFLTMTELPSIEFRMSLSFDARSAW